MSKRPLHFVWIVDTSGSMDVDGKIQALNTAVHEAVPELLDSAQAEPHAQLLVRVLTFSDGAAWVVEEPTPIEQFKWNDLSAGGVTDMGAALAMVADVMRIPPMEGRALPPVLVLVSDGQPTDDIDAGLKRLLDESWGKKAVKLAIAIGRDADLEVLQRFIGDPKIKPLQASNPEQLSHFIRWVSTIVKEVSQPPIEADQEHTPVVEPPTPPPPPRDLDVTW